VTSGKARHSSLREIKSGAIDKRDLVKLRKVTTHTHLRQSRDFMFQDKWHLLGRRSCGSQSAQGVQAKLSGPSSAFIGSFWQIGVLCWRSVALSSP
jgi:hypothetical protein